MITKIWCVEKCTTFGPPCRLHHAEIDRRRSLSSKQHADGCVLLPRRDFLLVFYLGAEFIPCRGSHGDASCFDSVLIPLLQPRPSGVLQILPNNVPLVFPRSPSFLFALLMFQFKAWFGILQSSILISGPSHPSLLSAIFVLALSVLFFFLTSTSLTSSYRVIPNSRRCNLWCAASNVFICFTVNDHSSALQLHSVLAITNYSRRTETDLKLIWPKKTKKQDVLRLRAFRHCISSLLVNGGGGGGL